VRWAQWGRAARAVGDKGIGVEQGIPPAVPWQADQARPGLPEAYPAVAVREWAEGKVVPVVTGVDRVAVPPIFSRC